MRLTARLCRLCQYLASDFSRTCSCFVSVTYSAANGTGRAVFPGASTSVTLAAAVMGSTVA